ncbi:hypothetical protein KEM52_000724 [Ascosphaera acerosa]|nr:hypothetical protein KEM52_000724 [Ascosphaera acerosa]
MRLPYAPATPPAGASASTADIYSRIAARRAPRPLIPLDLALLHSPEVADGWNSFIGAIRSRTSVDSGLMELAVCRIAVLNGAVYEWNAHAPLALKGGISGAGLQACRSLSEYVVHDGEEGNKTNERNGWFSDALSAAGWAVMAYADQMTRQVDVADAVFGKLREAGLTDREVVELTAGIGAYNCVSRFLVALDIGENNDKEMRSVEELTSSSS